MPKKPRIKVPRAPGHYHRYHRFYPWDYDYRYDYDYDYYDWYHRYHNDDYDYVWPDDNYLMSIYQKGVRDGIKSSRGNIQPGPNETGTKPKWWPMPEPAPAPEPAPEPAPAPAPAPMPEPTPAPAETPPALHVVTSETPPGPQ